MTAPRSVPTASVAAAGRVERVEELQARIRGMQATRLDSRAVPTHPALAAVLPGGALREGAVVQVEGSITLLMAALAGPSRSGRWVAVSGIPEFGVEAASRFGIDLERLVLVPDPGRQWLTVAAALADVIPVVAVRPAGRWRPPRRRGSRRGSASAAPCCWSTATGPAAMRASSSSRATGPGSTAVTGTSPSARSWSG